MNIYIKFAHYPGVIVRFSDENLILTERVLQPVGGPGRVGSLETHSNPPWRRIGAEGVGGGVLLRALNNLTHYPVRYPPRYPARYPPRYPPGGGGFSGEYALRSMFEPHPVCRFVELNCS